MPDTKPTAPRSFPAMEEAILQITTCGHELDRSGHGTDLLDLGVDARYDLQAARDAVEALRKCHAIMQEGRWGIEWNKQIVEADDAAIAVLSRCTQAGKERG